MKKYVLTLACLLPVVLILGCSSSSSSFQMQLSVTSTPPSPVSINFQAGAITGSASGVSSWSYPFTGYSGEFVSLSAAVTGIATVTVTIYENGSVLLTNTSSPGGTAQVSCTL